MKKKFVEISPFIQIHLLFDLFMICLSFFLKAKYLIFEEEFLTFLLLNIHLPHYFLLMLIFIFY